MTSAVPLTAIVYQARNLVNGHRYIGFTSRVLAKREVQHRSDARQGRGHILHKALRKYGDESFIFEVLADFDGDADLAKLYEFEAIEKYKPEYNIRAGGEGGGPIAESTRKKMSEAQKGRPSKLKGVPISAAHRQAIIDGKAKRDYHHTAETRGKISAALKGRISSPERVRKTAATLLIVGSSNRSVRCLEDGLEFKSCHAADLFYGFTRGCVSYAATGGRMTHGLHFVYTDK